MSLMIQGCVLKLPVVQEAGSAGLYAAVRNEVETEWLHGELVKQRKQVFYPKIDGKSLRFFEVEKVADLVKGRWGIREPLEDVVKEVNEIETIIIPAVAFDERGYRIGFGKGYYDRCLEKYRGVIVGCVYDFQVFDDVPHHKGDLRCDWIVTERRVIAVGR